jgi:hypothetical protein
VWNFIDPVGVPNEGDKACGFQSAMFHKEDNGFDRGGEDILPAKKVPSKRLGL